MNLVFYSTCSTTYDGTTFHYANTPLCKEKLENYAKTHPDCNIFIVSQLPGMFLLDLTGSSLELKAQNIEYKILSSQSSIQNITDCIMEFKPDTAVAITGFFRPFDWQGIKDGIIAQKLETLGVRAICNSVKTEKICFDKQATQLFLENNKFPVPPAVYCDNQLYWAERNHQAVTDNPYKESIFTEIEQLKLPLIIKDTTGLSSFGMEVVTTLNQAKAYLNSKKNNGNKIIQEMIQGRQFGLEVYGNPGNYTISPVFEFSVNQYKITSPKQSVKAGPVTGAEYKLNELKDLVLRVCEQLQIKGSAQIDLVFDNKKWWIIEINPRLSGMTNTVCESINKNYFELLTCNNTKNDFIDGAPVVSFKLPLIINEQKEKLAKFSFVKQINQVENEAAKQQRETGYCEIILKDSSKKVLLNDIDILKEKFPELIDSGFYEQAKILLKE